MREDPAWPVPTELIGDGAREPRGEATTDAKHDGTGDHDEIPIGAVDGVREGTRDIITDRASIDDAREGMHDGDRDGLGDGDADTGTEDDTEDSMLGLGDVDRECLSVNRKEVSCV